jgi:uncharacterized membrane protein
MSLWIDVLRWAHVIGATVLLGTGAGIAFFMAMAMRDARPVVVAHVAATVVVADFVFTAAAVVVQPITGLLLARAIGWPLDSGWLLASLGLYVFVGACWLPVVGIQIRVRDLARRAVLAGQPRLPLRVLELYRIWLALGFPAFAGVLGILWLMLTTPEF